ncbi:MAG: tRNA dihydrouridine synthase DusB [Chloroflexota bacterium]
MSMLSRLQTPSNPTFYIREIPIYGDTILSPMAGFSDMPYRSICRDYGSAMSYTEFVSIESSLFSNPNAMKRLEYDEVERPMTFQIFGCDVDLFEKAAVVCQEMGPDILDINMGCSAKTVANRGAGAGLLRTPEKIAEIFTTLTKLLDIPVTGKIRLGWDDDSLNYMEVAKIMEDCGASAIAIHGRTKRQAYKGDARWDPIAEIKQAVSIPVIGNGDVVKVADIQRMKDHTGCDAVMIARAAIGNPWIFAGKDTEQVTLSDRIELVQAHLKRMLAFYGEERGLVLFRKHVAKYTKGMHGGAKVRGRLMQCTDVNEFVDLISSLEELPSGEVLVAA